MPSSVKPATYALSLSRAIATIRFTGNSPLYHHETTLGYIRNEAKPQTLGGLHFVHRPGRQSKGGMQKPHEAA